MARMVYVHRAGSEDYRLSQPGIKHNIDHCCPFRRRLRLRFVSHKAVGNDTIWPNPAYSCQQREPTLQTDSSPRKGPHARLINSSEKPHPIITDQNQRDPRSPAGNAPSMIIHYYPIVIPNFRTMFQSRVARGSPSGKPSSSCCHSYNSLTLCSSTAPSLCHKCLTSTRKASFAICLFSSPGRGI